MLPGELNSIRVLKIAVAVLSVAAIALLVVSIDRDPNPSVGAPPPAPTVNDSISVGLTRDQIENRERELEAISGLTDSQVAGLLARMTAMERVEMGRRLTYLPSGASHEKKIGLFFRAWAGFDSGTAFEMALNFKYSSQIWTALASVFEGAAPQNARDLVESLKNLPAGTISSSVAQELLNTGLRKWASVDGGSAAEFLNNFGKDVPLIAWQTVAENWALSDADAALAWMDQQPNGMIKERQLNGIMQGWTKTDLPAAADYARVHLDGSITRESHVALAANRFAQDDPSAALRYIDSLPDGTAKRQAEQMAAIKWAYNDPAAAAAWVSSLPPERQGAATGVASMWATQDPAAAGKWVSTLPLSVRDSALTAYSASLASTDPVAALDWTGAIQSPEIRAATVDRLLEEWLVRDPDVASSWVRNNSQQLNGAQKERFLRTQP